MVYKIDIQSNKKSPDGSILGKIEDFQKQLFIHEREKINILKKSPLTSASESKVSYFDRFDKKEKTALMFGSNNYLGAVTNGVCINAAIEACKKFGIGSGGVPLLSGTTILQNQLEKTIARIKGFDDTIVFSSGFAANIGVLVGLLGSENLVIHDKLNHASLIDGSIMCGAKMLRFKHNNLDDLEKLLLENSPLYPGGILVATDGVYSMNGDIANLPSIIELTNKYHTLLLIDDAHATGVIGEKGKGSLSYHGISQRNNIIVTGTLSKAIGTVGGFITASQDIINYLRIFARSNMYSTALPPSVLASANSVLEFMQNSNIVELLNENALYLRTRLRQEGYNILNTQTAIVPIVIKDQYLLTKISKVLFDKGIMANYIFPPVVPPNLTRIRISVMASHTKEDLEFLINALNEIDEEFHIKQR
jgi:7-keto-8-aminopelargonate synthetase and related enzymes